MNYDLKNFEFTIKELVKYYHKHYIEILSDESFVNLYNKGIKNSQAFFDNTNKFIQDKKNLIAAHKVENLTAFAELFAKYYNISYKCNNPDKEKIEVVATIYAKYLFDNLLIKTTIRDLNKSYEVFIKQGYLLQNRKYKTGEILDLINKKLVVVIKAKTYNQSYVNEIEKIYDFEHSLNKINFTQLLNQNPEFIKLIIKNMTAEKIKSDFINYYNRISNFSENLKTEALNRQNSFTTKPPVEIVK